MKKSKRTLVSILMAVLVIALSTGICNAGGLVDSGTCGDNVTWRMFEGGTVQISGSGAMYDSYASFEDILDKITSVEIENGVTSIGQLNFYSCEKLKNVTLSDSVTSIGASAFEKCSNLSSITLSKNLKSIGGYAFHQCDGFTSINLPSSLTYIGSVAFGDCMSLTDVYYEGSEEEWNAIKIESYNYALDNARIHFGKVTPKAANPLVVKAKTAKVKYSKLKKKSQTLAVTKVIRFTNDAKDKKTYTLSSAKKGKKSFKKYFRINKTTGKVTVKKGLKKGTYKVTVKVKALGNSKYKASAEKTVTFKVQVK